MRHPADFFVKAMLIHMPAAGDADVVKRLTDWGFLQPLAEEQKFYLQFLRSSLVEGGPNAPPVGFNALDPLHRPSMRYLRDQKVYEYFYRNASMEEAWEILSHPDKRLVVEQALMARIQSKTIAIQINKKRNWLLTEHGVELYKHYFWNVDLLTFDEWGRFLYGRSAMYERQMNLLTATPALALHLLQVEQQVESKQMLLDVQRHCYFTFIEVATKPGTDPAKIKAMQVLGKTVIEAHEALQTSDTILNEVLEKFEKFRMLRNEQTPPSIKALAPKGNYSNSGIAEKKEEPAQKRSEDDDPEPTTH